ncbi:phage integrase family protein [Synechococcus sp. WH 8101]|uniref:site-specific integrase n=1 Tax=Synechococcus sp. WH 8101 TaxID=59932 RepID=UPI00164C06E9|nr:site-specific integrase [Synechococcus sp. WH 8101]QNI43860.1 phage integrase family protein [Synechococcus sp. WH 8101]
MHLRVSPEAQVPYLYKRRDKQVHLPVEERTYQLRIPVPNTKGLRKSLRTSDRSAAIEKAAEEVLELKYVLKNGGSVLPLSVEDLVEKFLQTKRALIRGEWEGKEDAGRRSITKERYALIAGKLRNYLVPFLGAKSDARSIPYAKWKEWQTWRVESRHTRTGGRPKAITLQNEMGMIRECWKWGMENSHLPLSPKLPFQDENLVTDDKVRRDTWEPDEWKPFRRRLREWLKEQQQLPQEEFWDAWVAYQMVFFLANCGMRVGELVKVKRKDLTFFQRNVGKNGEDETMLCCLVQVHKSNKTGAREVNAMGGLFARRVWDKSQHRSMDDFLFCHLDGTPFTTKQFRTQFRRMIAFTKEEERTGKHLVPYALRHFYASIRLQNGTSRSALCENMGCTEPYLRKHYSHYLNRLATADLMRMNKDIGLGGKVIPEGEDFLVPDVMLD